MGKRELLIIAAFVCLGAVAYRVTAPPPKPGERRFSFSGLVDAWRGRGMGRGAQASLTTTGAIPSPTSMTELTVSGAAIVVIAGEPRADIAWSLRVDAMGLDDAAARAAAAGVTLTHDDLGSVVAIGVRAPRGARQNATLTLRVPARLAVRLDAPRRTTIDHVASARLDNAFADADIQEVAGAVTGTVRNGKLSVTRVGSVDLTIQNANATFTDVRGDAAITVRNGMLQVNRSAGVLTLDATNVFSEIGEPAAAVRATTSGGTLRITDPRAEIRADAHGTKIDVGLSRAVPVTAIASGGAIRLALSDRPAVTIDAVTDGAAIDASALGLSADRGEHGATLRASLGGSTRIALRSDGGDIVIAQGR